MVRTVSEGLRDGVVDSRGKVGVIPLTLEVFPSCFIIQELFLAIPGFRFAACSSFPLCSLGSLLPLRICGVQANLPSSLGS